MAPFKTFGMEMDGIIILCLRCTKNAQFLKRQFLKDGVRTVVDVTECLGLTSRCALCRVSMESFFLIGLALLSKSGSK